MIHKIPTIKFVQKYLNGVNKLEGVLNSSLLASVPMELNLTIDSSFTMATLLQYDVDFVDMDRREILRKDFHKHRTYGVQLYDEFRLDLYEKILDGVVSLAGEQVVESTFHNIKGMVVEGDFITARGTLEVMSFTDPILEDTRVNVLEAVNNYIDTQYTYKPQ